MLKKLFIVAIAVISFSSFSIKAESYCNPCWMLEVLKQKIQQAATMDDVHDYVEAIDYLYGPQCDAYQEKIAQEQAAEQQAWLERLNQIPPTESTFIKNPNPVNDILIVSAALFACCILLDYMSNSKTKSATPDQRNEQETEIVDVTIQCTE